MSQVLLKEIEERWLHEIGAGINSLIDFLTRTNNGIKVYEQNEFPHPRTGRQIYAMSNGLTYSHDKEGKWYVV
jgi:hypothetical protein